MFQGLLRIMIAMSACFMLATQLGNGCATTGGGGWDDGYDRPQRPPDWNDDYDGPRIPSDARIVAEGRGIIRYRVPEDGRVWLYNATRRRTIADFRVPRGREFIVSPKDGRAWIDDQRVLNYDFDRDHTHRIYYLSDRGGGGWGGSGGSGGGGWGGSGGSLPSELRDADRVAYGRGDLSFNARDNGRVWVYDRTDRRIVYSSDVRRGDRVIVSPEDDYITISEARQRGGSQFRLNPRHDYEVYFKRTSGGRDQGASVDDGKKPVPPPDEPVFGGAGGTVPKSAGIVREGKNTDLSFEASGAGTIYVYDVDGKEVVMTYRLKKSQRFTFGRDGNVAVDGKTVTRKSVNSRRTYRLYFDLNV